MGWCGSPVPVFEVPKRWLINTICLCGCGVRWGVTRKGMGRAKWMGLLCVKRGCCVALIKSQEKVSVVLIMKVTYTIDVVVVLVL